MLVSKKGSIEKLKQSVHRNQNSAWQVRSSWKLLLRPHSKLSNFSEKRINGCRTSLEKRKELTTDFNTLSLIQRNE